MDVSNAALGERLRLANFCAAEADSPRCQLSVRHVDTLVGLRRGTKTQSAPFRKRSHAGDISIQSAYIEHQAWRVELAPGAPPSQQMRVQRLIIHMHGSNRARGQ
jgi:hypothetical protein